MQKIFLPVCLLLTFQFINAQLPAVKKNKIHIYLLVGQSNMAGRGKPEAIDTITNPHIWMFNKDQQWVPAKEPLAFDKPAVAGVGPGFAFAKEIWMADTNATICLIPCAVGGTRIDLWKTGAYDSATKTHPYDDALARAKKAIPSGELKGIIWHQGESDCNPALSATYENKLRELIARFRSDLDNRSVPFMVGEIADFKGGDKDKVIVNTAIRTVASTTRNCGFAAVDGLQHKGDLIHFDAPSARELGKRYAQAFLSVKM
jgi:hypothetical protein